MTSYEFILATIASTPSSGAPAERDIKWLTGANVVGVSRDHEGRLEVFLSGTELRPAIAAVRDAVEFHTWHRTGGESLDANRLRLPALSHYDQVVAFICTELLRNGADADLGRAFARAEPIIELSIEQLQMSSDAVLGLAGELLLLDALCRNSDPDRVDEIVNSWDGWRRSSRDFSLNSVGVEVKTTRRDTSSHMMQGVHQVELADGEDGGATETGLVLVSIGLRPAEAGDDSFTIPQLVERITARLVDPAHQDLADDFLAHVAEYGSWSGLGYDHRSMSGDPTFVLPYVTKFFRGYNMADPAIEVLRRDDIASHHHVDVGSVRFRVDLPLAVSADNPVQQPNQVARAILGFKGRASETSRSR
jgi:hypothetical protein